MLHSPSVKSATATSPKHVYVYMTEAQIHTHVKAADREKLFGYEPAPWRHERLAAVRRRFLHQSRDLAMLLIPQAADGAYECVFSNTYHHHSML